MLIILSDVEGLYSKDPSKKGAKIIKHVDRTTPEIEKMAGGKSSAVGTGGMYSKLLAAKQANDHGIPVVIMSGKKNSLLPRFIKGKDVGTYFEPKKERLSSKKGWIAYGVRTKGSIFLDDGAVKALTEMGRSLLPSGIAGVEDSFEVGDYIKCLNADGKMIAKGLTNYSSKDLGKIKGKKTSYIEKILGYKYSDEVIHRDNLVLV
jgi:glutamate 5-kinase